MPLSKTAQAFSNIEQLRLDLYQLYENRHRHNKLYCFNLVVVQYLPQCHTLIASAQQINVSAQVGTH